MDKLYCNEGEILRDQIELQALITEREAAVMHAKWDEGILSEGHWMALEVIAAKMRALKEGA